MSSRWGARNDTSRRQCPASCGEYRLTQKRAYSAPRSPVTKHPTPSTPGFAGLRCRSLRHKTGDGIAPSTDGGTRSDTLFATFAHPPAELTGKPFWAWNGRLERDELRRQIDTLHQMGFSGFFMHSRVGLETPYLGDEWFELIRFCAEEARSRGMDAWLYDEDRFPSGTAGGLVTRDPAYRMRALELRVTPLSAGAAGDESDTPEDDQLVAAFAARLVMPDGSPPREVGGRFVEDDLPAGLTVASYRRIDDRVADGANAVLRFFDVEMESSNLYNGYTYLNTMDRAATDAFLRSTHEQYAERVGDLFGNPITGVFVDEPHRGTLLDPFGSTGPTRCGRYRLPWTAALPRVFREMWGEAIEDRLPEIVFHPASGHISQTSWRYVETLQRLFLENFARPLAEWCRDHGLVLTGHILHEDSLTAQTAVSGSVMRYYEHLDYPGVDVLTEGNPNYWIVKQLTSASRQLGRGRLLSELYGCTGWQFGFSEHRHVGLWQALLGINLRCNHLSWYTMAGEAKRDFPGSILHQSAWWPYYSVVEQYFARVSTLMSVGEPICEVLVLNPVESVWAQVRLGWSDTLSTRDEQIAALEAQYGELFWWLLSNGIDFDYGDEAMLAERGSVTENARLRLGRAEYTAVVVGGMETIRAGTLALLGQFASRGGTIVFAGEIPRWVDASASDRAVALAARAPTVPWTRDDVVRAVRSAVTPPVTADYTDPADASRVLVQSRLLSDGILIAVHNTDRLPTGTIRLRADVASVPDITSPGECSIEAWDADTGTRRIVGRCAGPDGHVAELQLPAGGARFYVVRQDADGEPEPPPRTREVGSGVERLPGPWTYQLSEPNVLVLDFAEWRLGTGAWHPAGEILAVDHAIRDELGLPRRGNEMIQPWYARVHGGGADNADCRGDVQLRFSFLIEELPDEPIRLALESPESFEIRLNGYAVDAQPTGERWVDACFAVVELPHDALAIGSNVIELAGEYTERSGCEACYLLGTFGVWVERSSDGEPQTAASIADGRYHSPRIGTMPEAIGLGNLVEQGLPFYGGEVLLGLPPATERALLRFSQVAAACLVVDDASQTQVLPWAPYQTEIAGGEITLRIVLTRRNTFGPLHQVPIRTAGYGPENFVTQGDAFADDYGLIGVGLGEAITIVRS